MGGAALGARNEIGCIVIFVCRNEKMEGRRLIFFLTSGEEKYKKQAGKGS